MSSSEIAPWSSVAHGLIVNGKEAAIFFLRDSYGYYPPSITMSGGKWENGAAKAQASLQSLLGAELNVLLRLEYREDLNKKRTESHFLLEMMEPVNLNGYWIGRRQLDNLELKLNYQKPIIEQVLKEMEDGKVPAKRPPWARVGWHKEVSRWIEREMESTGDKLELLIEPVKNWSLSCVLRAESENGSYYFKTSVMLPLFVNEAKVVSGLGRLFPGHVPVTLAADFDQNWLLMADLGKPVGWGAPIEQRKGFIDQFRQLQRQSAGDLELLQQIGCLDRRVGWLRSKIDELIESAEVEGSIDEDEFRLLNETGPQLKELCDQMLEFNIPHTLVHGDLHGSNVAYKHGKYIFFDWTDACISHPFFDMVDIYQEKEHESRQLLRDHYLMGWIDREPLERLRSAWELGRVLASLNQALSYREIIVNIEPHSRHELDWGLPYWLRKTLDYNKSLRSKDA